MQLDLVSLDARLKRVESDARKFALASAKYRKPVGPLAPEIFADRAAAIVADRPAELRDAARKRILQFFGTDDGAVNLD